MKSVIAFLSILFLAAIFLPHDVLAYDSEKPSVYTRMANETEQTSAILGADINPNGSPTTAFFEFGTSADSPDIQTPTQNAGDGTSYITILSSRTGLSPDTLYYYRAIAINEYGISYGSTQSFRTKAMPSEPKNKPAVYTGSAFNITDSTATLQADINPNGLSTSAWFQFGKEADNLTNYTTAQEAGNGTSHITMLSSRSSLSPDTYYYYKAAASNANGISYGSVKNFKTKKSDSANNNQTNKNNNCLLPAVRTELPGLITENSAALKGAVNPKNFSTSAWFEYGETFSLGKKMPARSLGKGSYSLDMTESLSGLKPDTLYYYRIAAESDCGQSVGNILVFETNESLVSPKPNPPAVPAPTEQGLFVWQEMENLSFPNGIKTANSSFGDDVIEYFLYIKNTGSTVLNDIIAEDELPGLLAFVEASPDITADSRGNSLVWKIKTLKTGETYTIVLKTKTKQVEKSAAVNNSFSAKSGEIVKNSNKTTTIINPPLITSCEGPSCATRFTASVGSSSSGGWGWILSILLFFVMFSVFSALYLRYKLIHNL